MAQKVHMKSPILMIPSLCGAVAGLESTVTFEPKKVTCKRCLTKMKQARGKKTAKR